MTLFDAHLHPTELSQPDLESLAFFGVSRALAIAYQVEEPSARSLRAHFDRLVEKELPRMRKVGIRAQAVLGVHPQALPRRGLSEVLSRLPAYFRGARVAAIGEIGLHLGGEPEEEAFLAQLELARELNVPVVVHTPAKDKERLTRRLLVLLRQSGVAPGRVLVDHASARTVRPILACGHYAGLSVHPPPPGEARLRQAKPASSQELTAERAAALIRRLGSERLVLDSDAGHAAGDLLAVPRTVGRLEKMHLSDRVIARVGYQNAAVLFGEGPA